MQVIAFCFLGTSIRAGCSIRWTLEMDSRRSIIFLGVLLVVGFVAWAKVDQVS